MMNRNRSSASGEEGWVFMNRERSFSLRKWIRNPQERKLVRWAIGTSLVILVIVIAFISGEILYVAMSGTSPTIIRHLTHYYASFGSLARLGFFFAVSLYPIFFVLKRVSLFPSWLKQGVQFIAKLVRKWHVPVSLLAMAMVGIHAYMALVRGFELKGSYISGIAALILLGVLAYYGLLRYRKMDRNWHLILGLLFVALFIVHTMFS